MSKTKEDHIRDARAASRLLDDEDLSRFLADMEGEVFASMKIAKAGDTKELEMLHARLLSVDHIRIYLKALVDAGAVAQKRVK